MVEYRFGRRVGKVSGGGSAIKTLSIKMPPELHEQVLRYADLHGTTVSALIREGLALRMGTGASSEDKASDTPSPEHDALVALLGHVRGFLSGLEDQLGYMTGLVSEESSGTTEASSPELPVMKPERSPPYDTARFYLGKLCPQGHEHGSTGMSLLRRHNQSCRECENERKRQARARKAKD